MQYNHPMIDIATLQAALVGYQAELARIDGKIAEIRRMLGKAGSNIGGSGFPAPSGKRTMSAAGRKRVAAAQRKRWAEYRKKQRA
jgi:hypothetical protein